MIAQLDKQFLLLAKRKAAVRLLSYLFEGRPLTTRGRFINVFVFMLYRLFAILPIRPNIKNPIFILGTGRSGTTILGVSLGIHKEVTFLNEPKAFWSYIVAGEDLIGSYSRVPGAYTIPASRISEEDVAKAHKILSGLIWLTRGNRLVDKYPELIFRTDLVKKIFPDAKFIFLFRNGYDTCFSISLWSRRKGGITRGESHDWWGLDNRKWCALQELVKNDPELAPNAEKIASYTDHFHKAAVEWIVTMKKGMSLAAENRGDFLMLRYEEYIADQSVRESVLKFCALPTDSVYERYCLQAFSVPPKHQAMPLPSEIRTVFARIMLELGYEA